jgi:hypothetical protein
MIQSSRNGLGSSSTIVGIPQNSIQKYVTKFHPKHARLGHEHNHFE